MYSNDMFTAACAAGDGGHRVQAVAVRCGADLSVTVFGGTGPHVGAVSLAQYEPERDSATVSTVTAFTHRDDAISARFAKTLSAALKCTVSVTAGLHLDGASAEDIAQLQANSADCLRQLLEQLTRTQ